MDESYKFQFLPNSSTLLRLSGNQQQFGPQVMHVQIHQEKAQQVVIVVHLARLVRR
jgi:hypothetical protein